MLEELDTFTLTVAKERGQVFGSRWLTYQSPTCMLVSSKAALPWGCKSVTYLGGVSQAVPPGYQLLLSGSPR